MIAQDFAFVEIKQVISCGISTSRGWAAVARPGQFGDGTGTRGPGAEAGSA